MSLGIGDAPGQQLPGGQTQRANWQGEQVYQFEVDVEYLIWRNTSVETKRKTKKHMSFRLKHPP